LTTVVPSPVERARQLPPPQSSVILPDPSLTALQSPSGQEKSQDPLAPQ